MPLELDTRAIEWIGDQYSMYYYAFKGTPIKPSDLCEAELKHRAAKATLTDLRKQLIEKDASRVGST